MNEQLKKLSDDLKNIVTDSKTEVERIIENSEIEILDLNREQIFVYSEQATGEMIPGNYSKTTEAWTQNDTFTFKGQTKKKTAGEPYFLLDTGDFFGSFRVETNDKGFKIQAQTRKPKVDLIAEYGDLLGLNENNTQKLSEIIYKNLVEVLENYF